MHYCLCCQRRQQQWYSVQTETEGWRSTTDDGSDSTCERDVRHVASAEDGGGDGTCKRNVRAVLLPIGFAPRYAELLPMGFALRYAELLPIGFALRY